MAKIIDGLGNFKTLKYAHSAEVAYGEVVVVNGQVLIACDDYKANVEGVYMYEGRAALPKATGQGSGIDAVSLVYWDADPGVASAVSSGNTLAGLSIEAAATTDDEVVIMLKPNLVEEQGS